LAADEGAAAAAAAAYDAAAGASLAARLGYVQRQLPGRPAAAAREDHHLRLSSFVGLTEILQQQQAQLEAGNASAGRGTGSPALRAMTWHRKHMDDTPAGRELRRNWQRQIILETKALDATRARYQKEQLSAIARGQAAALPEARQMLLRWFGPMTQAIQREQQRVSWQAGRLAGCWAVFF
jgi:hypothetical protein